jgi:hypothetical protein
MMRRRSFAMFAVFFLTRLRKSNRAMSASEQFGEEAFLLRWVKRIGRSSPSRRATASS